MIPSFRHLLNRFDTERIAFRLTASYRRIEQLEKQDPKKFFTASEQEEFQSEINRVFMALAAGAMGYGSKLLWSAAIGLGWCPAGWVAGAAAAAATL
jgi:hypothetical protein